MIGHPLAVFLLTFKPRNFMEFLYDIIWAFMWLVVLKVIEELLSRRYKSKWLCFILAFIATMLLVALVSYLLRPYLNI
jgi:predicted PurR-regulated permease PerM